MGKQKDEKPTTSLGKQLQNLKKQEPQSVTAHSYVSLLFERQQASLLSSESLWNLAVEGLQDLIKLDARFQQYEQTLFSFASKDINRDLQTRSENAQLDISVNSYLQLLSPYFMLRPAHKTLEYLIRKYR